VLSVADLPAPAEYRIANFTVVSGARCRLASVTIQTSGSSGVIQAVVFRNLTSNVDVLTVRVPTAPVAGQGLVLDVPLGGFLFAEGFRVRMPPGVTALLHYEEEPLAGQGPMLTLFLTLNQCGLLNGLSVPHPLHGQKKWGVEPVETAFDETWDADVDGELFEVKLPVGFTTSGNNRLVLAHHQLKNAYNSCSLETLIDEKCTARGYVYASPTTLLSDTWPNDTAAVNLNAVLRWIMATFGVHKDHLNLTGFSLGGQQVSRFAAVNRDPDGLMARSIAPVAPDWEQLVWYLKLRAGTSLGDTANCGDEFDGLCDPAIHHPLNTKYRSSIERPDQMGGPWPGGDGLDEAGLQFRASAILAIDPETYAETEECGTPQADDLEVGTGTAVVDKDRSLVASGLWTPTYMVYAENDVLIIIPPLTRQLLKHIEEENPGAQPGQQGSDGAGLPGPIGYAWQVRNMGIHNPVELSHSWALFDVDDYLDWLEALPSIQRLPARFQFVTHRDATCSFLTVEREDLLDLSRISAHADPTTATISLSGEVRVAAVTIRADRTPLAAHAPSAPAPLKVTTEHAYPVVVRGLAGVPTDATGTNVGIVTIPAPDFPGEPNSILIEPDGPGPMTAEIV